MAGTGVSAPQISTPSSGRASHLVKLSLAVNLWEEGFVEPASQRSSHLSAGPDPL